MAAVILAHEGPGHMPMQSDRLLTPTPSQPRHGRLAPLFPRRVNAQQQTCQCRLECSRHTVK